MSLHFGSTAHGSSSFTAREGERVQEKGRGGGGGGGGWKCPGLTACQQTQLEEKGGYLDPKKKKWIEIDDAEVESNKEFVGSERWGRCLEPREAISQASDVF